MLLITFYHLQCNFYYIYVVNYDIVFIFFLLGIRTIVNLWSRNKFIILIINIVIITIIINKRLRIISVAPLNAVLIRIVTIFYS